MQATYLLSWITMVLKAEYHRKFGCFECTLGNCFEHIFGQNLGNKCVAMHNHWFTGAAIPKVQFDTPVMNESLIYNLLLHRVDVINFQVWAKRAIHIHHVQGFLNADLQRVLALTSEWCKVKKRVNIQLGAKFIGA